MSKGISLQEKADILRDQLGDMEYFTISDLEEILSEKKSTLYWTVWNLHDNGFIRKLGKGLYTFQDIAKDENPIPILSTLGKKIHDILIESGYDFFISGLDVLSIFMLHVPERYPVLTFVDRYSLDEVQQALRNNDIQAIDHSKVKRYSEIVDLALAGDLALLNVTKEFSYARNGIAVFEKAFVDLYYEVTRKVYPLPLQELARILTNLKRRTNFDSKRLIKIASRRSLQYDIRFIVENRYINPRAFEFVKTLKYESQ